MESSNARRMAVMAAPSNDPDAASMPAELPLNTLEIGARGPIWGAHQDVGDVTRMRGRRSDSTGRRNPDSHCRE